MKGKQFTKTRILLAFAVLLVSPLAVGQTHSDPSEVAAVVDGTVITQEQVDTAAGTAVFALQEKLYAVRKAALESLILEAVLENAARKQGLTLTEFKKGLMPTQVEVKQDDVDAVYLDTRDAMGQMNVDEARQRIRLDLESRLKLDEYKRSVAAVLAKATLDIRLRAPQSPSSVVRATGPVRGEHGAPVTIVEYSDFECPYCKSSAPEVKKLLADYGDDVALVYKHMPLPNHPNAFRSAQASVCAGEQNKFWEYHDRLFASSDLSESALLQYASELGLKSDAFNACMTASSSAATVRRDLSEALQAGVRGTPAFFVNGRAARNTKGFTEIRKAIDEILQNRTEEATKSQTVAKGER